MKTFSISAENLWRLYASVDGWGTRAMITNGGGRKAVLQCSSAQKVYSVSVSNRMLPACRSV